LPKVCKNSGPFWVTVGSIKRGSILTGRGCRLAGCLGGQLLPGGLASGGLTSGLLGTSHFGVWSGVLMNFRMKNWTRNRSENKWSLLEQVWSDQLTWIEWTKIVKFDFIINNNDDANCKKQNKIKKAWRLLWSLWGITINKILFDIKTL